MKQNLLDLNYENLKSFLSDKIGIEEQKQKLLPVFPSCLSDYQNNVKKQPGANQLLK